MNLEALPRRQLIRRFFKYYPDYLLCRTLAENVEEGVTSYAQAVAHLAQRARAGDENREAIRGKLDDFRVVVGGQPVRLKELSLQAVMDQSDEVLTEILKFYFKHPYAHGRTKKSRLLPRWLRTLFLSALLGHAKRRGLELDYSAYFEMVTLL